MIDNHFGAEAAARYDASTTDEFAPHVIEATVDTLVELSRGGPALELAVGTGRVALPLAERGIEVAGIELSPDMAGRLREKDPGERVEVTLGDMTTERVDGRFRLVYLVYNTIGNVETQDRQVACFLNAAAHLEPGGRFVVEMVVPDLRRLPPGNDARVFAHSPGYVGYDRYVDLVEQRAVSHHFVASGDDIHEFRTPWRYVWPSELDLMAKLAGMSLVHRWGDWDRSSFTGDSEKHISVWELVQA
jgi:SAM-dependent methyltransferase